MADDLEGARGQQRLGRLDEFPADVSAAERCVDRQGVATGAGDPRTFWGT